MLTQRPRLCGCDLLYCPHTSCRACICLCPPPPSPIRYNSTIRYSTLATYFDHVHALNQKGDPAALLPVQKKLDFEFGWPHSWSPSGYPLIGLTANFSWQYQTGAASARPSHKQRVRASAARLRTAAAVHTLALAAGKGGEGTPSAAAAFSALAVAQDALGVTQHHDSLPGTMQAAESLLCPSVMAVVDGFDQCTTTTDPNRQVLEDYTRRLQEADNATAMLTTASVAALQGLPGGSLSFEFNASAPTGGTGGAVASSVVVFNPASHSRRELVRAEFRQIGKPYDYVIPTVYQLVPPALGSQPAGASARGRASANVDAKGTAKKVAVAAQVEVEDRHTSQFTVSAHSLPTLTNAVFFYATIPPFGSARFSVEFEQGGERNSTTTIAPEIVVGAAAVAKVGLGYPDDPQCQRAEFSAGDGLLAGVSVRHDGAGCHADGGPSKASGSYSHSRSTSAPVDNRTTTAAVRQTFWQYVDGSGGPYCLIEQTRAVEVRAWLLLRPCGPADLRPCSCTLL